MRRDTEDTMVNHEGTITAVDVLDDDGWHLVVTQADPTVLISDELLRYLTYKRPSSILTKKRGAAEVSGDLLSLGTPGKGLGRLTYRLTARGDAWHLAELQDTSEPETERS